MFYLVKHIVEGEIFNMKHTYTIVVIFYNSENYVEKCIESILAQTITDFELILVDDGSTDSTLKICYYYQKKDNRIKVIHQINGGISSARNTGINNATGTYIVFVDGDDWLDKYYLESMNDLLLSYGNTDCILGRMTEYTEETGQETILGDDFDNTINTLSNEANNGKTFFINIIKKYGRFPMGMAARGIYKLDVLKKNNIFFKNKYYEDIDFTFNIIYHSKKILCNPYPYYYFRNHSSSTSKKIQISYAYDIIELMIKWKSYAKADDDPVFAETVSQELSRRYTNMIFKYAAYLSNEEFYLLVAAVKNTKNLLDDGIIIKCRLLKIFFKLLGISNTLILYRVLHSIYRNMRHQDKQTKN